MENEIINSKIDPTSQIYLGARVKNSFLGTNTIVGNFSRVDNSRLNDFCRINRNNHIFETTMGKHTYTGMNTVVMHAEVGSFCSISWSVSIGGAHHDFTRISQHAFLYNKWDRLRPKNTKIPYNRFSKQLKIGSDVWIGSGAAIMRGVSVGTGAVIGANSVVTKDIPPYAIVVGNPAKIIKYRFDDDIITLLLKLKWWEMDDSFITDHFHLLSEHPTKEILQSLLQKKGKSDSV